MRVVAAFLMLLLAAGCSVGGGSEAPKKGSTETADTAGEARELEVERVSSGARGSAGRRVVLASSAAALRATGEEVPDSGRGTYLAAYWGEKPTGGYSVTVESARIRADRVTVRLALGEPPPDALVTQAITYPYAVAVIRGLDPRGKDFSFVDQNGRKLGWPVRRAPG